MALKPKGQLEQQHSTVILSVKESILLQNSQENLTKAMLWLNRCHFQFIFIYLYICFPVTCFMHTCIAHKKYK